MAATLTDAQLDELRTFDSATIANAIEPFKVRDQTLGYVGSNVRALFPNKQEPMVGYAVTAKGDSTTYARRRDPALQFGLWEAMDESPGPSVVVIQDSGNNPSKSCHCGDVMGTLIRALGGIGLVTDGGVRDLPEVEALGLHYFARGPVVAHGTAVIYDAGEPVVIDGVPIKTGDLLHGDVNGLVTIPAEIAGEVADAAREVIADETRRKAYADSPEFTIQGYRKLLGL